MSMITTTKAYEDIIRHRADREFNHKIVQVIRDGELLSIKSKEIQVFRCLKL